MIEIVLIRHGATEWNDLNRYQGRTDIPLTEAAKNDLGRWNLTERWIHYDLFSSPLQRARETAGILFPERPVHVDSRLIETDFGRWEGEFVESIRQGQDFSPPSYGWQGWDSGPPGGETYQQVADRLESWLDELELRHKDSVVVTHKGVILVALAMAHRWDLNSKRPFKIQKDCAQVLMYSSREGLQIRELNLPLTT
ncbi:histidine phosphatase family protein [Bdellovibrio bacteriovorus]|uniref:Phosphoglycerate mutase n=1 Tax=Bdellovibrio bacteriovorus str. Tiberius TaxID=1069642 RepID=K7Z044_BDEBC|nr:histidine phosphatase family protein [Bdellovibrio bacteriovorus]AFY02365.1 phosphoglycerate mutase [Bdellovibrio bacteriovorus str. Tiberius]